MREFTNASNAPHSALGKKERCDCQFYRTPLQNTLNAMPCGIFVDCCFFSSVFILLKLFCPVSINYKYWTDANHLKTFPVQPVVIGRWLAAGLRESIVKPDKKLYRYCYFSNWLAHNCWRKANRATTLVTASHACPPLVMPTVPWVCMLEVHRFSQVECVREAPMSLHNHAEEEEHANMWWWSFPVAAIIYTPQKPITYFEKCTVMLH